MLSTAKSFTEEPKSIIPERKNERARIPSASPNSGIEIISEFSEDGSERVTFAGKGSRWMRPERPRNSSFLSLTSSSRTLKGAEPVLFITSSLFPVGPSAPGSWGGLRTTEVRFDNFRDMLASPMFWSIQNLAWSSSIVNGVEALEICTSIESIPSGAYIASVSPSSNSNCEGNPFNLNALY